MQSIISFCYLASLLAIGLACWRACLDPAIRHWADWRIASVIAIVALGEFAPNIWTYYAAVVLAIALLPRSRTEAVALFLAITFMLPLVSFVPFLGTMRLVDLSTETVGSLGLIAALRFPPARQGGVRGWSLVDVGFVGLAILVVVIAQRIPAPTVTSTIRMLTILLLTMIMPYFAISRMATDADGLRRVLHAMAMAGFMMSLVAVFEMVRHWPLYGAIDHNLGTSVGRSRTLAIRAGMLRAPGPFFESTGFSAFLALAVTLLAANGRLFRSRDAHGIAILVGCAGAFATLARNGWVGLAVGLVLVSLYRGRGTLTAMIVIAGGATLVVAMALAPQGGMLGALLGSSGHAESTGEYRENLLKYGFALYQQHALFGLPIDEANTILQPVLRSGFLDTDWVNSYLFFAVGTGTIGVLVFLFYTLAPMVVTLTQRRAALRSTTDGELAAAVFAGGAALAIMIFFLSYSERVPLMCIIIAGGARQLQARLAAGGTRNDAGSAPRGRPPALVVDPARPVWAASRREAAG